MSGEREGLDQPGTTPEGSAPDSPTSVPIDGWARLIYRRDVIMSVRERWNRQYAHSPAHHRSGWCESSFGEIREALAALDLQKASVADVNAAIGTGGWASLECDCCGSDVEVLVRVGEEPDYEARWQDICVRCAQAVARLIEVVPVWGPLVSKTAARQLRADP